MALIGDSTLAAISKSIADTAVDVFVYDTRKDSDGGAWRKRCQHTSWYNETLNTATRGSRKEFPAVAVIVAESGQLTIYDGDDPDMPMWMEFVCSSAAYATNATFISQNNVSGVSIKNAKLCVSGSTGFVILDFITEEQVNHRPDIGQIGRHYKSGAIVDRNDTSGQYAYDTTASHIIVANPSNDVAMTVLPNAPIDPATGLPVPTIAVATDGGVSVIKDDGSVVDFTTTDANYKRIHDIDFRNDGKITSVWGYTGNYVLSFYGHVMSIPNSDVSIGDVNNNPTSEEFYISYKQGQWNGRDLILSTGESPYITAHTKNYFGMTNCLAIVDPVNSDPSSGMVSRIGTEFNSGWMVGDTKLATLCSTDSTNISSTSNLVTNGTFTSDVSGWTDRGSGLSWASGVAQYNWSSDVGAYQSINTDVGKTYTIFFDVLAVSAVTNNFFQMAAYDADGSNVLNEIRVDQGEEGSYSLSFKATTTTSRIEFMASANQAGYIQVDNISCYAGEADRSAKNGGLQVFGTVTKNPVATGADLVAYSGFSSSNYLQQPYNSDLDFGTGSQSVIAWFKLDSTTGSGSIVERGTGDASQSLWVMIQNGGSVYFDYGGGSAYTSAPYSFSTGVWYQVVCHVTAGGTGTIYVNGKEVSSYSVRNSAPSPFANSTSYNTYIGYLPSYGAAFNGSIALVRISATVPSAEQIKKIYEDEKVLFQENAQATLYGSSDAVTALAYDDDTNLLHVGTSAGRSVFQGLRRVDNTTSAVGAAISASNGLVAED